MGSDERIYWGSRAHPNLWAENKRSHYMKMIGINQISDVIFRIISET